MTTQQTTVSLVLGSGGARGFAHIGVIHWLEENGFNIKSISGCSIGALIGGVYAAGKLEDFSTWSQAIRKVDIVTFMDISWKRSGLVKGDKIISILTELVGDVMIEDLPISYTAVATDILNEKEVWINSGKLFDGIRASMSLPLLLTPFRYKGIDLIDGGVLNPVPIAPTFNDRTDLTIAVNLSGKPNGKSKTNLDNKIDGAKKDLFSAKITAFLDSFKDMDNALIAPDNGVYDIAHQAFDAMQSTIARQKLAAYPPDHFVDIPRNACRMLEFDRATEMIELGYQAAEKSLRHIKR
ncbi:patatin-like phospholipase family protein [Amphritea sp. 2_MG-2023]|jgi:NTE family protein|uniref:patatin-like phospholipase family protein n=1 Tax=Amphritea TaxID=515417 RepID=UPI001C06BB35|nr:MULTISPECIES: patatin-like phospholipase family protein [Amphritea]MBU2964158.1 patatin-like phospholipase family protein [Amphritea atlantica]MDO6418557.1 patatin-like phospholipase family protein [Amphritea sp. 2_MG-2023]MDX2424000.1 patatin-like phospholipase family protein [Amphritea sp.]